MQDEKLIIVDAGNSFFKCAEVVSGQFRQVARIEKSAFKNYAENISAGYTFVISSVLNESDTHTYFDPLPDKMILGPTSHVPIRIDYDKPQTLGFDRICNAVAVNALSEAEHKLSIDIGTCIKFDLVSGNTFSGGSISPGINLRYRSLNDYTGKLPYITDREVPGLVAQNTQDALRAGVMHGIQGELNYLTEQYRSRFPGLHVYITGGDAQYFDFPVKNNIFADANLTLKGMYQIYSENV